MLRRSLVLKLSLVVMMPACGADPAPPAETPSNPAPVVVAPATPCDALARPRGTLRRLASIVSFGRSMPVRPLHPGPFAERLDEVAREAKAVGEGDAAFAKIGSDAGERLATIAKAARALEAARDGGDRLRVKLLEEMERGELSVLQIEERCAKDGGASGGRHSAAALESGTGRMSAAALQRALRSGADAMKKCGDAGLRRDPSLVGTVRVRFVVGRDGRVSEAVDTASGAMDPFDWGSTSSAPPLRDAEVIGCVVRAFEAITFPKPEGGTFTATYAIEIGRAR